MIRVLAIILMLGGVLGASVPISEEGTSLSLGVVLVLIAAVVWGVERLTRIDNRLQKIEERLAAGDAKFDDIACLNGQKCKEKAKN